MESPKSKMKRIVDVIYDIVPKSFIEIKNENKSYIFTCLNSNNGINLYNSHEDAWLFVEDAQSLNELRKYLLLGFLNGEYQNIKKY